MVEPEPKKDYVRAIVEGATDEGREATANFLGFLESLYKGNFMRVMHKRLRDNKREQYFKKARTNKNAKQTARNKGKPQFPEYEWLHARNIASGKWVEKTEQKEEV